MSIFVTTALSSFSSGEAGIAPADASFTGGEAGIGDNYLNHLKEGCDRFT